MQFDRDTRLTCQFPISLAVEGEACYAQMAQARLNHVIFCDVIYSPYRLVLPRYPGKGIYSLEEGRYYHAPDASRYRDLPVSPEPSRDFAGRDLLAEAVRGAKRAGLTVGAWVTIFANGRIAKQHPDWAAHNLYDSADRLFLCFNHPEVREYSLRVCEEIADRYEVDEIMLDKIPQLCLEQNTFSGRIDPVLRVLGSFCFCPHCQAAAKAFGLDLSARKQDALALAAQCLAISPHLVNAQADELTGDMEAPLLFLDQPWVLDLLRFRIASIRSFLTEVRRRIDAKRTGIVLSMAFVPPVKIGHDASSPRAWLGAQSYAAYKDSAADLIHCVVHWDADVVEYNTRRAVNAVAGGRIKINTHVRAYGPARPQAMAELTAAVRRGGADGGIGYFCYDLMTKDMLQTLGHISS